MTRRHAIAAAVLALVALGACGRGGDAAPAARVAAGSLTLALTTEPTTPREGANRVRIAVHDAAGEPVDDVEIALRARMEMAGMAPMQAGGPATPLGGGVYLADVALSMSGTWQLSLEVKRAGRPVARALGSLTTGLPGLRLEAGAAMASSTPDAAAPGAPAEAPAPGHAGHTGHAAREHEGHASKTPEAATPVRGEVHLSPERMRQIGIRSAPVGRAPFDRVVRAVGRVAWDESALVDVALKVRGWVEKLGVDAVGVRVERGQPLLWIYSPELFAAQQEYLSALRSQRESGGQRSDVIVRAAHTRLRLWDLSAAEIDAIARRGTPAEALAIRSPASGVVIEKDVSLGAAIEPGRRIFRIAPLDRVWVEAELQEDELEGVAPGAAAVVTLPSLPGRRLEAKVAFVYPYLEPATRSARVRFLLGNADFALRPDMYADVELRVPRGERLLVPASAVLYAGPRRLVFVDLGAGRLQPREVTIGAGNGESYEVLAGLAAGDRVVVSGNFLVAAESRLRSVLEAGMDETDDAW